MEHIIAEREKQLQELSINSALKCKDKEGETFRARKDGENSIFVYAKGKKRYGWRYPLTTFATLYDFHITTQQEKTLKWHKRLNRAINSMKKSGLWENIRKVFENLLKLTYEEKQEIYKEYFEVDRWGEDKSNYNNFIAKIKSKYPFMIYTNAEGQEIINTDYIYEISECELKSMYFGKFRNTTIKEQIKESINNKQDFKTWARTNYDTSFQYDAEKKRAWYSEEYKDCGNGHYYLALDESTALFCEND